MRLIENSQVPRDGLGQPFHASCALECIDADDQSIVLGEGVAPAVGNVTFRAEHLEIQTERLVELTPPVVD